MVVTDEVSLSILVRETPDDPLQCGSGHESAGEVVEVGEGVTQWKAGGHTP